MSLFNKIKHYFLTKRFEADLNKDQDPLKLMNNQIHNLGNEINNHKINRIKEINSSFNLFENDYSQLKYDFLIKLQERQILSFFSSGLIQSVWYSGSPANIIPTMQKRWKITNFSEKPNGLFVGGDPDLTLLSMINFISSHYAVNHSKTLYIMSTQDHSLGKYDHFDRLDNVIFSHSNQENSKTKIKTLLKLKNRDLIPTLDYLTYEIATRTHSEFPPYEIVLSIEDIDEFLTNPATRDKLIAILKNGPSFNVFVVGSLSTGKSNILSMFDFELFKNIFVFKTSEKESKIILQSNVAATIPDGCFSVAKTSDNHSVEFFNLETKHWIGIFKSTVVNSDIPNFSMLNKSL